MPGPSKAKLTLAAAANNLNDLSSVLFEIVIKETIAAACVNNPSAKRAADNTSITPIIFSRFSVVDLNKRYPIWKITTAKITLNIKGAAWE